MEDAPIDGLGGIHDFGVQHDGIHRPVMCPAFILIAHHSNPLYDGGEGHGGKGLAKPARSPAALYLSFSSPRQRLIALQESVELELVDPDAETRTFRIGDLPLPQTAIETFHVLIQILRGFSNAEPAPREGTLVKFEA